MNIKTIGKSFCEAGTIIKKIGVNAVDCAKEISYGLKFALKPNKDTVVLNSNLRAEKVIDKSDRRRYFQVYINELNGTNTKAGKALDYIQSWIYSRGTNKKLVRIFKNDKGAVVGGYTNKMQGNKELNITELGLRGKEKSLENIKGICYDIKAQVCKKNPKEIFVLMTKDSTDFINVFEKLGFKTHKKADGFRCDTISVNNLTQMSIRSEDFLKNFYEKLSVLK